MPRGALNADVVTAEAAALADEIGLAQVSMSVVAKRLNVKTPSLYKHVAGWDDLVDRIAILAAGQMADAVGRAIQGWSGQEALARAARAFRDFVREHPGRYAATVGTRRTEQGSPVARALDAALAPFDAALSGFSLPAADRVHALRALRSILHGFSALEHSGGFELPTDIDASFEWLVAFVIRGFSAEAEREGLRAD